MNLFFYTDDSEILETWISISSFKYFRVVGIEKQIRFNIGPFITKFESDLLAWPETQISNEI